MAAVDVICAYCRALIRTRIDNERGASAVEYAFLVSLVAVACVGALSLLGNATSASLSDSASRLP